MYKSLIEYAAYHKTTKPKTLGKAYVKSRKGRQCARGFTEAISIGSRELSGMRQLAWEDSVLHFLLPEAIGNR